MIAALDVQYEEDAATAACVLFEDWSASAAADSKVTTVRYVAPYEPGALYKRELPCLLAVLKELKVETLASLTTVIVDGHVWLDSADSPGLGAHLYEALDAQFAVVGVAKNPYHDSVAITVLRGGSERPLYVTAVGMEVEEAAEQVRRMHGAYRVPTLLKLADSLARGNVT